jgi:hypothetical protein
MAGLALVFLVEKNWRHGVRFNLVVGSTIALLGCAVLVYPDLLMLISGVSPAAPGANSGM